MAIEKLDDAHRYEDTPEGNYRRWMIEIGAAKESLKTWKGQAVKTVDRFLDKRGGADGGGAVDLSLERHMNLYTANVQTLRALLYGKVPNVDVGRRFGDAKDDVARVSAEILERVLNSDIERDGDGFKEAIGSALDDRLIPGFGQVRLRYTCEMGEREVPPKMAPMPMDASTMGMEMMPMGGAATMPGMESGGMPGMPMPMVEIAPGYTEKCKTAEDVETDYVHWDDFLWSPCRTWADCRWVAFGVPMTREDLVARFGAELGKVIPLDAPSGNYADAAREQKIDDVWGRAYVWEIWDKSDRKVRWLCEGYAEILDTKPDTLKLAGFFPCPRPLLANVTTTALIPLPDYVIAQDQYRELDEVTTRISALQEAVQVRGIYDEGSEAIGQLVTGTGTQLIPVKNWALHAEKGGAKGQIDWMPLDMIVSTLRELEAYRDGLIAQLYQVTGLSDIVRGQAQAGATATEQSIKAKFASVRLQALQDEVSRFASDAQRIRAEIVVAQFDDQTILDRANYAGGNDQQLVPQALQLLREKFAGYRIEIKPENINLADMATLKNERMEFLTTLLQGAEAMTKVPPPMALALAETMQWALASFKGSSQIEGTFDRMVTEMQQAAQAPKGPPRPDPKMQAQMAKAQGDQQKIAAKAQADIAVTNAKTQGAIAVQGAQAKMDLVTKQADEAAQMRAEERAAGKAAVDLFTGGGV